MQYAGRDDDYIQLAAGRDPSGRRVDRLLVTDIHAQRDDLLMRVAHRATREGKNAGNLRIAGELPYEFRADTPGGAEDGDREAVLKRVELCHSKQMAARPCAATPVFTNPAG